MSIVQHLAQPRHVRYARLKALHRTRQLVHCIFRIVDAVFQSVYKVGHGESGGGATVWAAGLVIGRHVRIVLLGRGTGRKGL